MSSPGSSSRASGLPPRLGDEPLGDLLGAARRPRCCSRRARAASGSRPVSTSSARPCGSKVAAGAVPGGEHHGTRSAPSRRAQNSSAPAVAGSSQWASSTTHSTRFSSAAAVSSDKVATPTRNGSTDGPVLLAERDPQGPGLRGREALRAAASAGAADGAAPRTPAAPRPRAPGCAAPVASPALRRRARRAGPTCPHPARRAPPALPADPCRARSTSAPRSARSGSRPTSTRRPYTLRGPPRARSNPAL